MSGSHFHVHGPHDHAVEHAGHGEDPFASNLAVITAVRATIGARFSYMGGATQNDAMLPHSTAAGLVLAGLALAHIGAAISEPG